jgi:hypothetical protein
VRPAPEVDGVRVVDDRAVRGEEHAAAGPRDARQLPHALRRVVDVLEHLDADRHVEGRIRGRDRLDRADEVGVRVGSRVETDILGDVRREERRIRLLAAAGVEQPVRA